jgi:hypothetical protein
MTDLPMDPVNVKLRELGPEFALAMDTPRIWATGVQTFPSTDTSLIVFREQNLLREDEKSVVLMRNVASILMPTAVMKDFYEQLGTALELLEANAKNGE